MLSVFTAYQQQLIRHASLLIQHGLSSSICLIRLEKQGLVPIHAVNLSPVLALCHISLLIKDGGRHMIADSESGGDPHYSWIRFVFSNSEHVKYVQNAKQ